MKLHVEINIYFNDFLKNKLICYKIYFNIRSELINTISHISI